MKQRNANDKQMILEMGDYEDEMWTEDDPDQLKPVEPKSKVHSLI